MTTRIRSNFSKAVKEARKSQCNYRLGSVVVKRRKALACAYNSNKTHTLTNTAEEGWKGIHAEIAACLKVPEAQLDGSDLYVVRILRNEALALSRPCEVCQSVLFKFGVCRVFYSISNSEYGVLHLNS